MAEADEPFIDLNDEAAIRKEIIRLLMFKPLLKHMSFKEQAKKAQ